MGDYDVADKTNMTTVETTGDFILQDITNGAVIAAEGATETERTAFIETHIERGHLKEVSGKGKPAEITGRRQAEEPVQDTGTFTSSPSPAPTADDVTSEPETPAKKAK